MLRLILNFEIVLDMLLWFQQAGPLLVPFEFPITRWLPESHYLHSQLLINFNFRLIILLLHTDPNRKICISFHVFLLFLIEITLLLRYIKLATEQQKHICVFKSFKSLQNGTNININ